jgi:hypothetical protein
MMPQKRSTRRSERRETPRADARLSMRVEGAAEVVAPSQIVTESQNISASGVYCHSTRYLAPLSKVALTIVLPRIPGGLSTQELVKCDGIVVRCDPDGRPADQRWRLACMFSGLEPGWRQRIEEFVTWRNLQALRVAAGLDGRPKRASGMRAASKSTRSGARARTSARRSPSRRAPAKKSARRKTAH